MTQHDAARPANPIKARLLAGSELLRTIREDRQTNLGWLEPGFHALAAYRLGRWALDSDHEPTWKRRGAELAYTVGHRVSVNVYGIDIPRTASIGRRVIVQEAAIGIHPGSVIGDDCVLRKGCTIGGTTGGETFGDQAPVVGDGVSIGVNAVVAGKITVGDHAAIGPNVAVLRDVPPAATVIAPKPRVIQGLSSNVERVGASGA